MLIVIVILKQTAFQSSSYLLCKIHLFVYHIIQTAFSSYYPIISFLSLYELSFIKLCFLPLSKICFFRNRRKIVCIPSKDYMVLNGTRYINIHELRRIACNASTCNCVTVYSQRMNK